MQVFIGRNPKSMIRWIRKVLRCVKMHVSGGDVYVYWRCQTVRRDNCRLVSTVIETCLHKMLIDRDVKGAEEWVLFTFCPFDTLTGVHGRSYTKQTISDLLQNKVDM